MEDQLRDDAQIALFCAMSLHSIAFDDRELMSTLLCRVSDYIAHVGGVRDARDLRQALALEFSTQCGSAEAARERLLRAARACLDDPEDSDEEAKFLMDVAALSPESPNSPPEPAAAIAAGSWAEGEGKEEVVSSLDCYMLVCERRKVSIDDVPEFLEELDHWAGLVALCLHDDSVDRESVDLLLDDIRTGLKVAEYALVRDPNADPVELVPCYHRELSRELAELASARPIDGYYEAGRELAKAQLRRRRELERERDARRIAEEAPHV